MIGILKKFDEVKKDKSINVASELLAEGTAGLTAEDAEAVAALAVSTANVTALKGKLTLAQEQAIAKALVVIGSTGVRLFGGLFKNKSKK